MHAESAIVGRLLIDGLPIEGQGELLESRDPIDGTLIWSGYEASITQVEDAMLGARKASRIWAACAIEQRFAIARKFAQIVESKRDELATLISRETGKPLWESKTEVATVIAKVENSIDAIVNRRSTITETIDGQRAVTRFKPHGVLLVLGPFNLPAHLPGSHIVPALLAGNAVVFKPSEQTPAVGQWLAEAWNAAGLPAGCFQLLHGAAAVAQNALENPETDGVLFTGSYRVGKSIHHTLADRPECLIALEMGGNNPLVVGTIDHLGAALYNIVLSAYITSGQRCTCARRLIVQSGPDGDRVVEALVDVLQKISVGLPFDEPACFLGGLIHVGAAGQIVRAEQRLVESGATRLVGLREWNDRKAILTPGLLDATAVELPDEEHFGPLLVIQRASNLEDAVRIANQTTYGLAAGLLSDRAEEFEYFVNHIRAGIVNWNRQTTGASGRLPFGGVGRSGNHRPSAWYAADYSSYPVASLETEKLTLPAKPMPGLDEAHTQCLQK